MSESNDAVHAQDQGSEFDDSVPPGNHALEVAARAGFGPLSALAQTQWHGQGVPCVSCGQLVRRDDAACEHCGQDLSEEMIRKMRQHAGPWFVLEHVRPFPGVSLERIVRQIRRGLITETSIVRGPSNDYQWRFAVETPGLCRYFGKCWCCHSPVSLSDAYCSRCLHYLSFEKPRTPAQVPAMGEINAAPAVAAVVPPRAGSAAAQPGMIAAAEVAHAAGRGTGAPTGDVVKPIPGRIPINPARPEQQPLARAAAIPQTADLARLSAAVRESRAAHVRGDWDQPQRVGGVNVAWIAALLIIGTVVALLLISRARSERPAIQTSPALPVMQAAPAQTSSQPATQPAPVKPLAPDSNLQPSPVSPATQPPADSPNSQVPAPSAPATTIPDAVRPTP